MLKRYLKSEQTHTHTDGRTNPLIESIGAEGRCFENWAKCVVCNTTIGGCLLNFLYKSVVWNHKIGGCLFPNWAIVLSSIRILVAVSFIICSKVVCAILRFMAVSITFDIKMLSSVLRLVTVSFTIGQKKIWQSNGRKKL